MTIIGSPNSSPIAITGPGSAASASFAGISAFIGAFMDNGMLSVRPSSASGELDLNAVASASAASVTLTNNSQLRVAGAGAQLSVSAAVQFSLIDSSDNKSGAPIEGGPFGGLTIPGTADDETITAHGQAHAIAIAISASATKVADLHGLADKSVLDLMATHSLVI